MVSYYFLLILAKKVDFILFVIVFLLMTLVSASISVFNAIINTDRNLRNQLPAITSIHLDSLAIASEMNSTGGNVEFENVNLAIIEEIASLPYVRLFDYSIWSYFFNDNIRSVFPMELFLENDLENMIPTNTENNIFREAFALTGVQTGNFPNLEMDLIQLIEGRTFTESEINGDSSVVILSRDFLMANQLRLGDTLEMSYRIYDLTLPRNEVQNEDLLLYEIFELEIIGVFEHNIRIENDEALVDIDEINNHINFINQLYVPNHFIISALELYREIKPEHQTEFLQELLASSDSIEEVLEFDNIMFLLNDPTELLAFHETVSTILPEFWTISDLSSAYADIESAMVIINDTARFLLLGTISAAFIILSLLIILFLQDRKTEIGIYLSLGEQKTKIIKQLVLEIIIISTVATTCALFAGHLLSNNISTNMLRNELINQNEQLHGVANQLDLRSLESQGFYHHMTHEEMLDNYDVSLDIGMTIIFYVISLSSVLLSTIIPTIYLTSLNPKMILMKSNIG